MSFGHEFKKKYFPVSNNLFVPVNHGSFGLTPQVVMDKYYLECERDLASPDTFIKIEQPKEYLNAIKEVSKLFNCAYSNLALVSNATTGVNTILRSFPFAKGDIIAMPSTTYGACANTVKFLSDIMDIKFVFIELAMPMLNVAIVETFRKTFEEHKVKLALFDTVVSMPGSKLPFLELTRLCAEYNVLSLIDGAHSAGLIPVDLSEIQPDFYTSNLHKWLYVPRPCAVLYVSPKHFREIQSMPVSHSYVSPNAVLSPEEEANLLVSKFTFSGSISFAGISCIKTALDFRKNVCGGEEAISKYCFDLARQVGELALRKWPGSTLIENEERSLTTAMVTIFYPLERHTKTFDLSDKKLAQHLIKTISATQIEKYKTFVPFDVHRGKLFARFSCQVYNELVDYEYACEAAESALKSYFGLKL